MHDRGSFYEKNSWEDMLLQDITYRKEFKFSNFIGIIIFISLSNSLFISLSHFGLKAVIQHLAEEYFHRTIAKQSSCISIDESL